MNATQAAIRAGYSVKTANEQGARLLANVSVAEAIAEAQSKRSEPYKTYGLLWCNRERYATKYAQKQGVESAYQSSPQRLGSQSGSHGNGRVKVRTTAGFHWRGFHSGFHGKAVYRLVSKAVVSSLVSTVLMIQ